MPYPANFTRSFYQWPFVAEHPSAPHDAPEGGEDGSDYSEHQSPRAPGDVVWKHVEEQWDDETLSYHEKIVKASNKDGGLPAFIIRDTIDKMSGRKLTTFELSSPDLHEIVAELSSPYETRELASTISSIDFERAYHSRGFLRTRRDAARAQSQWSRYWVLKEFNRCLETICSPLDNRLRALLSEKKIAHELLWCVFPPEADLFTTCQITGSPRCVRVARSRKLIDQFGTKWFRIETWFLDTNGPCTYDIDIPFFDGASRIDSLSAYPLDHHPRCKFMMRKLIENGRRSMSWAKIHPLEHKGIAFSTDGQRGTVTQQREGRIIVDRASTSHGWYSVSSAMWKEKDLLLCSPTVSGFCLITNEALQFAVEDIGDVVWLPSVYDRISMPDLDRQRVLTLATQHYSRTENPILKEMPATSGRGTRLLLYGTAGVGKTTMASSIAERCKRPLLSVSVGSIGVNPTRDEDELATIFYLAERWEAVLVIEEADVLLAEIYDGTRTSAVIAMAIRKLKGFNGLVFLITSRLPSPDEPIRNTIDCVVGFQPLNGEARKKLWQHCLGRVATLRGFPDSETLSEELVSRELNGHEIQSIVHMACSIAEAKGDIIRLRHLEAAFEMRSSLWSGYGKYRRTQDSV